MLEVVSLEKARELVMRRAPAHELRREMVALENAAGRTLCAGVASGENVPAFSRSSVDGFAVMARDTVGCSDAIPALLTLRGEVEMGETPAFSLEKGCCAKIPTGGALPDGADAAVMLEYCERLDEKTVAAYRPVSPGNNVVFLGDDIRKGDVVYAVGTRLSARDIGALASLGICNVEVFARPRIAVISTGDELIPPCETPRPGQIRDVNSQLLCALLSECGAEPVSYGIVKDIFDDIKSMVSKALAECDAVLLSGGTSAGEKDAASLVLEGLAQPLFHGLALKPGKPTAAADAGGKMIFALPGNPSAAYFVFLLLVGPFIEAMMKNERRDVKTSAALSRALPSNGGREECVAVALKDGMAEPVDSKSGLIATLRKADGYVLIPRSREGIPAGETVEITLFGGR